jgi:hypothetical protein
MPSKGYKKIEPRWKKGETGNPKGRPVKLPELDKLLAQVLGEEKDGITAGEVILKAIRAKAAKGDVRAAELLLDRAYGKPRQTFDTTLTTTEPLVIVTTKEPEQSNTSET